MEFSWTAYLTASFKFPPPDYPCCQGNEIWDKIGYNSAYIRDISEMFASNRGFSGTGYWMTRDKFYHDQPPLPSVRLSDCLSVTLQLMDAPCRDPSRVTQKIFAVLVEWYHHIVLTMSFKQVSFLQLYNIIPHTLRTIQDYNDQSCQFWAQLRFITFETLWDVIRSHVAHNS